MPIQSDDPAASAERLFQSLGLHARTSALGYARDLERKGDAGGAARWRSIAKALEAIEAAHRAKS
jgi:hypothetical protein